VHLRRPSGLKFWSMPDGDWLPDHIERWGAAGGDVAVPELDDPEYVPELTPTDADEELPPLPDPVIRLSQPIFPKIPLRMGACWPSVIGLIHGFGISRPPNTLFFGAEPVSAAANFDNAPSDPP